MSEQIRTPLGAQCDYGLDSFLISVLAFEALTPKAGSATLACRETKDVREVIVGRWGMRLLLALRGLHSRFRVRRRVPGLGFSV